MRSMLRYLMLPSIACLLVAASPGERELPGVEDEPAIGQDDDPRPDELRTQMERLNRGFQEAYNRHDAAALARLYTNDAVVVTPEGQELRGRDAILAYFEESLEQMPRLSLQPDRAGGHGDTGWEYGHYSIEGPMRPGQAGASQQPTRLSQEGHYLVVTRHQAGRGQIELQVAHPGATAEAPAPSGP